MKKIIIVILIILLVLGSAIILFAGNYLVTFGITRKDTMTMNIVPEATTTSEAETTVVSTYERLTEKLESWKQEAVWGEAEIFSEDDLKLKADVVSAKEESHKWLLVVHGYMGKRNDMYHIAQAYWERGFNTLMPDMRAHGESEGTYIGMGWLDRKDILRWIDYIISIDSQAEIYLHGVSMGGATVMMVSGEELPGQVKGITEDCGYTSVWDIFSDELEYLFGLPDFPFLYSANLFGNIRAGYDFKEASAVEQVKKSQVPMVFIHGGEDNFVKTEMVYDVYEACPTEKELLVIEGAGHGQAYGMDPELYFGTIFEFFGI